MGDKEVNALRDPGFYHVGGVTGLGVQVTYVRSKAVIRDWEKRRAEALEVSPEAADKIKRPVTRSWVLRYTFAGRTRDKGLGSLQGVGLARARELAREALDLTAQGKDPVREAAARKSALAAAAALDKTFKECAQAYIKAHENGWKNVKHAKQWPSSLETYVYPHIGNLFVRDITIHHVEKVLEPIWFTKNPTATRVRSRMENVLDFATAKGYRTEPNPARWKGSLKGTMTAPHKVNREEKHHPAVQVEQVAAFTADLRKIKGVSARALEFLLLTAGRTVEVLGACWSEFDLQRRTWTVPAERMKGSKKHDVPLSSAAMEVLKAQPRIAGSEFVFTSPRSNGQLSDMSMSGVMKRMGYKDVDGRMCVPHGLRSTFSDWGGDFTDLHSDVTEMALAHAIPNATKAAYRRRTAFEKRRIAMEQWASFCNTPFAEDGAQVLPFRAA